MKRSLIGAIVLVATLALAGCGNNNQNNQSNKTEQEKPAVNRLLIIVDPQVDFTTGSLATAKGPEAMDQLAKTIKSGVLKKYSYVVVTQDAHPENHCSFVEQGGPFPPHCVQDTKGMKVYPKLQKALDANSKDLQILYLQKGDLPDKEEFSIFQNEQSGTKLRRLIKKNKFDGIDICGIATDYCVYDTTKDLMGFYPANQIRIITNCIAAVDDNDTKLADLMDENGIASITY